MRRVVESRNLVNVVVSTAVGLYLFRNWPFPAENDLLQMVLLQKPYLFYGIKYGFISAADVSKIWVRFGSVSRVKELLKGSRTGCQYR